jgi:hypothetical protein
MATSCTCSIDAACPDHAFGKEFEEIGRAFSVAFSKESFGTGEETPHDVLKRLKDLLDRQREARRHWKDSRGR